ncbi:hypothetical protein CEXT_493701 [Caerostris extrusa]|uniref:Uncharacterized protein n=1 Tax=Caerostris extrusa TaxID=172846 RepID=A0AAV4YF09_CAEEX|nr:hypothetical protein CEXT_493701 [Caerostris extrusa]
MHKIFKNVEGYEPISSGGENRLSLVPRKTFVAVKETSGVTNLARQVIGGVFESIFQKTRCDDYDGFSSVLLLYNGHGALMDPT